jgi:hypothetical protein
MNFEELKDIIKNDLEKIQDSSQLREFSSVYLGKKGKIRNLFLELKDISLEPRKL